MNVTGNVHIGGALLLPYFNYKVPDDFNEIHASPDEFLDQTRGALEYYSKLFQHQKIFDQVYVVGWEPLMKLDNFLLTISFILIESTLLQSHDSGKIPSVAIFPPDIRYLIPFFFAYLYK